MTPHACLVHGPGRVHLDGPCGCFRGGDAPEWAALDRPEPDPPGWYGDDHGWADRDDAHRVTFEGGAA